jgi:hypothetical protein
LAEREGFEPSGALTPRRFPSLRTRTVAQRKGTHDFYNEIGLEAFTWRGRDQTIVLTGDAHMRKQDAKLAARTATVSLAQVIDAASGAARGYLTLADLGVPSAPDAFDT